MRVAFQQIRQMKKEQQNDDSFKRKHKQVFRFNDQEYKAFNKYCKKYNITNKAKFFRQTIVTAIIQKFEDDYPTLFDVIPQVKETQQPIEEQSKEETKDIDYPTLF